MVERDKDYRTGVVDKEDRSMVGGREVRTPEDIEVGKAVADGEEHTVAVVDMEGHTEVAVDMMGPAFEAVDTAHRTVAEVVVVVFVVEVAPPVAGVAVVPFPYGGEIPGLELVVVSVVEGEGVPIAVWKDHHASPHQTSHR